jgi:hypothetical protein
MRTLSSAELTSVSGGFDYAGYEELNPGVLIGELIVFARKTAPIWGPILISPIVDDLWEDFKSDREIKRQLEEDAKERYSQELSTEISKRLAAGEGHNYFIQGSVAYYKFTSATYFDDGADGTWDRKE